MARPPIERVITGLPPVTLFKPAGVPGHELEHVPLTVDELEAMRLVDLEGLSHEQAASAMGVSRQTVGRVLEAARATVTEALVSGKAIVIGGGQFRVEPRVLCCRSCKFSWLPGSSDGPPIVCPSCGSANVNACWRPDGPCGAGEAGCCTQIGKRRPAAATPQSHRPTDERESR
jgi:uncharacterized protein